MLARDESCLTASLFGRCFRRRYTVVQGLGAGLVNKTCTSLDLSYNGLTHESLSVLCRLLGANECVEELDLSGNQFSDFEAMFPSRDSSAQWIRPLRILALGDNPVRQKGLRGLAAHLARHICHDLQELSLEAVTVDEDSRFALSAALGANAGLSIVGVEPPIVPKGQTRYRRAKKQPRSHAESTELKRVQLRRAQLRKQRQAEAEAQREDAEDVESESESEDSDDDCIPDSVRLLLQCVALAPPACLSFPQHSPRPCRKGVARCGLALYCGLTGATLPCPPLPACLQRFAVLLRRLREDDPKILKLDFSERGGDDSDEDEDDDEEMRNVTMDVLQLADHESAHLSSSQAQRLAAALSSNTRVVCLDLSMCTELGTSGLRAIATCASLSLPCVTALHLMACDLGDEVTDGASGPSLLYARAIARSHRPCTRTRHTTPPSPSARVQPRATPRVCPRRASRLWRMP